jgi:hypothetical protein
MLIQRILFISVILIRFFGDVYMVDIQTIKNKGKTYQVIRDDRGRIIERSESMSLEEAQNKYKTDNTLTKNEYREKLTHMTLIYSDAKSKFTPDQVSPLYESKESRSFNPVNNTKYTHYMYYVTGRLKNRRVITASSRKFPRNHPTNEARNEAFRNFWSKVSSTYYNVSTDKIDEKVVDSVESIKEGFIYFKANQEV